LPFYHGIFSACFCFSTEPHRRGIASGATPLNGVLPILKDGTHLITEVKQRCARIVHDWVTAQMTSMVGPFCKVYPHLEAWEGVGEDTETSYPACLSEILQKASKCCPKLPGRLVHLVISQIFSQIWQHNCKVGGTKYVNSLYK
jgi:hypothetical protein